MQNMKKRKFKIGSEEQKVKERMIYLLLTSLLLNLGNCWQVLVVRQDLKMGAGKIASQCARKILQIFFVKISKLIVYICCFLVIWLFDYCLIKNYADAATGLYSELMQRYVINLIIVCYLSLDS